MQQEQTTTMPSKGKRQRAVSALVLLGAFAVLSTAVNGEGRRATGLMPEVVCTADRPRLIVDEIIVRASRPIPAAVARLSGINK